MTRYAIGPGGAGLLVLLLASSAAAQFEDHVPSPTSIASPENLSLELRIGPYRPGGPDAFDTAFEDTFGNDQGPLLGAEIDLLFLPIPYVGRAGVGVGFGWVRYSAKAKLHGTNERSGEFTDLTLFPVPIMAVLRADGLARHLGIPLIIAGKLGLDMTFWDSDTGSVDDHSNVSMGLRWALQFALELDFFDPAAARSLDEEWGINHTFVFFELFGSTADSTLPTRPKDGLTWAAGLGFVL